MSEEKPITHIETGDTVYHKPSRETWLVAVVWQNELMPMGWPESIAKVTDCQLVDKGDPDNRLGTLRRLLLMRRDDGSRDQRAIYAEMILEHLEKEQP